MKFRLALDELKDYDKKIEASGLTFVVDPFAASFVEAVSIDYDEYDDQFIVHNLNGPESSC
jgi:Fe-S cluster assembly iron-binding protein IscA